MWWYLAKLTGRRSKTSAINVPLKGSNAWNKLPVPANDWKTCCRASEMSPPTFYMLSLGKCDYLADLVLTLKNCTLVSRRIHQSTSVCVAGKRYNLADVSAALSMSLGLIWFTLADSKVAPNFNVTGISFSNSWLTGIWQVEHCVVNIVTWVAPLRVCGLQVSSSSLWLCVLMLPLGTYRKKPWNFITAPTLKWCVVHLAKTFGANLVWLVC